MKRTHLTALLLTGALAALTPLSALADGTPACTTISNIATLSYNVGGSSTSVDSASEDFIVGNKVIPVVTVQDGSPGVTTQHGWVAPTLVTDPVRNVLTFTVTNDGNKIQDYDLSTVNLASAQTAWAGITDEVDAGAATAYVESGATAGYQFAEDTATFIDGLDPTVTYPNELNPGTKTVYVVVAGPVPATASNNSNALYALIATTHQGEGAGLGLIASEGDDNGSCGEDTVFADLAASTGPNDANEDGKDSDRSGLVVDADATLTVSKSSTVYSDPVNGAGAGAKAIPGAVVTYTILVTNPAGSTATATSVSISDSLATQIPDNLAFGNLDTTAGYGSSNGSFKDGDGAGVTTDCTGAPGQGIVVDDVCKTNLDAGDDNVDWEVTSPETVTVTGISLAPGASTTIKFQVTIQ